MLLKYIFAWFGMMALAVVNGSLRDFTYATQVGELAAHQISTITLIILLSGYIWLIVRFSPIKSAKQAWTIGGMWFLMTEADAPESARQRPVLNTFYFPSTSPLLYLSLPLLSSH